MTMRIAAALVLLAAGGPAFAGDPAAGEKSFGKCKACHTIQAGGKHLVGPNLHGVYGRAAGGADGYKYSPAMKDSKVVWDDGALHRYLADPKGFIPKNKMAFPGVRNEAERANLIAYLKQAAK